MMMMMIMMMKDWKWVKTFTFWWRRVRQTEAGLPRQAPSEHRPLLPTPDLYINAFTTAITRTALWVKGIPPSGPVMSQNCHMLKFYLGRHGQHTVQNSKYSTVISHSQSSLRPCIQPRTHSTVDWEFVTAVFKMRKNSRILRIILKFVRILRKF